MEANYFALHVKENLEQHPEVFAVTEESCKEIEEKQRELRKQRDEAEKLDRAKRDAANPEITNKRKRDEYMELRRAEFRTQQAPKSSEVHLNNKVGEMKLLEQRITDLKAKIKSDDNVMAEHSYRHQIQLLETELRDMTNDVNDARRWNSAAVQALKDWPNTAQAQRLKALRKELSI